MQHQPFILSSAVDGIERRLRDDRPGRQFYRPTDVNGEPSAFGVGEPRIIRYVDADRHLRLVPPVDYDRRPQSDTPLVAFFRRWQFRIGIACFCVATAVAMFFAFQIGRGVGGWVFG